MDPSSPPPTPPTLVVDRLLLQDVKVLTLPLLVVLLVLPPQLPLGAETPTPLPDPATGTTPPLQLPGNNALLLLLLW